MPLYKHAWHLLSEYCIHCGVPRLLYVKTAINCIRDKKVIAISHIRAKHHGIRTSPKNIHPSTK
jgi:hypothetical protein